MPDTHLQALSNAQTIRESKGRSIIAFPDTYCVIDVETTGRSPQWDHIIEVAAVKISDGRETGRFSSLIQPPSMPGGTYVGDFIEALTGITDEMLAGAPFAPDVLEEFATFVEDAPVVGHCVSFDIDFLYDSFDRYLDRPFSNDYIDTLRLACKLHPEMSHHRLADLVRLFDVAHNDAHRAMGDVEATAECFARLKAEALERYGSEGEFQELFRSKRTRRRSVPEGHGSVREGYRSGGSHSVKAADIQGDAQKIDEDSPIFGCACVFTGKLEKFTRAEAMQIVADLGGINQDGVTKTTRYLVLGNNDYCASIKDGKSNKQKKAEKWALKGSGIEILPETAFYDMLGEELLRGH